MERVTPLRHLVGMELMMNVVTVGVAVMAGLLLVVTGLFSVATLVWGDLLESEDVTLAPIDHEMPKPLGG